MVFNPYKRDQLETIVQQRLKDAGVPDTFEAKAIRYAAGKVGCGRSASPHLLRCRDTYRLPLHKCAAHIAVSCCPPWDAVHGLHA